MPIPSTPPALPMPIANSGDVRDIPETTPVESGQMSYQAGFPYITQVPLLAGGIAPARVDMNAALKLLSQHTFFQQSGGFYPWMGPDAGTGFPGLNYLAGNIVIDPITKALFQALQPSGPDMPAGPQPISNSEYWGDLFGTKYWVLTKLTENLTVYVDANGNDATADGTQALPFKTISAALQFVAGNYFLGTYTATIQIAAGTYDEMIILPPYMTSGGVIVLQGAGAANTIISKSGLASGNSVLRLSNASSYVCNDLLLSALDGIQNAGIVAAKGSMTINRVNIRQGDSTGWGAPIKINSGASLRLGSVVGETLNFTIQSGRTASCIIQADTGSSVQQGSNITANGAVEYGTVSVNSGGSYERNTPSLPTFTGTVMGKRYGVTTNGVINVQGAGANFFPGTVAGTAVSGGQYV